MTKIVIKGKKPDIVRVGCDTSKKERKAFRMALAKLGLTATDILREAIRETIKKAK